VNTLAVLPEKPNIGAARPPRAWLPLGDESRVRRLVKIAVWIGAIALVVAALELVGVDVRGWFSRLWDTLTEVPFGYLMVGWSLQALQTTLTAVAWYFVLRAAFPQATVSYRGVLAAYATGVALNGFLPANIGTLVMMLMFVAIIPGSNFAGVVGAAVAQKIFFTVAGAFVYVYLFLSVPGSFELRLRALHDRPVLFAVVIAGGSVLIVTLVRIFWPKLKGLWEKAKRGGAILARPREYALRVALPSLGAWLAKLGVIAVFLAAYGIPVTFHAVMTVVAGNSIGNAVSVTPGGVGVNQATNAAALSDVTDPATATAYSLGQQLAVTIWNIVFALALVVWVFGWAGGRELVERSYANARAKTADRKAQHAAVRHPPQSL
jgi:uncharacterized membrane protein YbhN (UPF0104 family)